MKTTTDRLHYIDVAKGILIVLVVIHHIPQIIKGQVGISDGFWAGVGFLNIFYASWFMPAFFFLSGMCSNFDRQFPDFLRRNVKSLLIPAVVLPIVGTWLLHLAQLDLHPSSYLHLDLRRIVLYGSWCWFLPALFVARLVYWTIHHWLQGSAGRIIACLTLLVVACALKQFDVVPNFWMHRHALAMVLYIALGQCCRQHPIRDCYYYIGGGLFLLLTLVLQLGHFHYCWITNAFRVEVVQIPLHLALCLTGICLVMTIARLISSNALLELLGRNSLYIYVFQYMFLQMLIGRLHDVIADANMLACCLLLMLFIAATLAASLLFSWIMHRPYLRYCIGEF